MVLTNYFYKYATELHKDRVAIPELSREDYMNPQYIDMFYNELNAIEITGKVGVVYSCGASMHQAECRICEKPYENSLPKKLPSPFVIKNLVASMMHKYVGVLENNGICIEEAEIVSNTCSSSLHAVVKAKEMLSRLDHVVVITEEKTSFDTIRIFAEHRIDVKPSDGFALAVLSNVGEGIEITDSKTAYEYNRNPFMTTASGYSKVRSECDVVKVHGTGTDTNDSAEKEAFDGLEQIEYKSKIGHSQGSSGLLELCMAVDDARFKNKKVLCVASGLGGFYASCVLHL